MSDQKEKPKSQWVLNKERFYDKLNLSLRTVDIILALGIAGLVIVAVLIGLDAAGIIGG